MKTKITFLLTTSRSIDSIPLKIESFIKMIHSSIDITTIRYEFCYLQ